MKHSGFRLKLVTTAVLCSFLMTTIFYACKKDETTTTPADKTCLTANVATAQALIDGTVEGTKPGQYIVGSKAPLQTALDASNVVLANASATQSDVTNACAQLQAAIDAYGTNLITEISPDNLIGFWKFNGNANDSSGKGNNGTLTTGAALYGAGLPVLTTDRFGRANMAYHFDHGGNVDVPYTTALNPQQMSISLWCNKSIAGRTWDPSTYTMVAMNRWNGYKFQLQGGNLPFYTVKVDVTSDSTTIYDRDDAGAALNNDTWYHLVVTFKSGEEKFYINGDLVMTWPTSLGAGDVPGTAVSLATTPIDFIIGQDLPTDKYLTEDGDFQVAWGGFWTGDLDDVMFYNLVLDGTQVKSIYENQKTL